MHVVGLCCLHLHTQLTLPEEVICWSVQQEPSANRCFGSEVKNKYTHDFSVLLSPSLADTELQLRRDSIFCQSLVAAICTFSEQLLAALNYRYNNNGEYEESSRDASRKWLEQIAATGVLLNYQSLLSPAAVRGRAVAPLGLLALARVSLCCSQHSQSPLLERAFRQTTATSADSAADNHARVLHSPSFSSAREYRAHCHTRTLQQSVCPRIWSDAAAFGEVLLLGCCWGVCGLPSSGENTHSSKRVKTFWVFQELRQHENLLQAFVRTLDAFIE